MSNRGITEGRFVIVVGAKFIIAIIVAGGGGGEALEVE